MFESLNAYSFLLVAVNLIILYIVLRKILFKPVTAFMEKRTQSIKDAIADAEKQTAEAKELKASYEKQLGEAKIRGNEIIAEASEKAGRKADELIEKAKDDANLILQNGRDEIAREREQMLKEIHNQVAALAIEAASKIMQDNMSTAKNMKLVEKFLEEEGAA